MHDRIAVSACLLGVSCKYSGGDNYNANVLEYLSDKIIIPVCPELYGKMGVPREPCEIVNGMNGEQRVMSESGADMTHEYMSGARLAFEKLKKLACTKAILKANSPSCGAGKVYDGTFTHTERCGYGCFAALFKESGIDIKTEKDF